ncbi:glycosyltransferase family 2 protein [Chryseobacterium taiwanense]|uniref:glycosyltransferase family 2 protein n=1 Tax=Chryseobacterium taiwanense TaxID=363331 RepID=UPI00068D6D2D|nr:glycosyltransferase family 2 protein [Chryseobacterium taiwanense]
MKTLAILLSTYNGEKYLKEQIDSILQQSFSHFDIYIRDDGSTDCTIDIIQEYINGYSNIHFFKGANLGAALSFMDLLKKVNSDYYMFCDQDDVWLQNKIEKSISRIVQIETKGEPALVFSDAKIVDEKLNLVNNSFWNYNKTFPEILLSNPKFISVFNCSPGCTMIFNNELKKHLTDYDEDMLMHDWYIMIKALQKGVVSYINTSLMLYRQHSNNTIGANEVSVKTFVNKVFLFPNILKEQIKTFKFVKKYTNINLLNYYILKIKFNYKRLKI